MSDQAKVIDASVRFLRTNPELLAYAQSAAPSTGRSVEQLLRDVVTRARSEREPVTAPRSAVS